MRTITTYHYDVETSNGELSLELPIKMSEVMDNYGKDTLVHEANGKIMIGYLFDDSYVENPCEDDCGFGHIYTAHRHSKTQEEMRKALGLDTNWEPALEDIDDWAVCDRAMEMLKKSRDLVDGTMATLWINVSDHFKDNYDVDEDKSLFEQIESTLDCDSELEEAGFDPEAIRKELWNEGRLNGTIGDKHAVSLDVYEHSMVRYSVSGGGPQCQWDTAQGGAVWVPSDSAREEIVRRGVVYQKGKVMEVQAAGVKCYTPVVWTAFGTYKNTGAMYKEWHLAFKALEEMEPIFLQSINDAEDDAARELAHEAAETYTDWCNGNCFGHCIVTYDLDGDVDGDPDMCGTYYGSDEAYNVLKEEFDARKQNM